MSSNTTIMDAPNGAIHEILKTIDRGDFLSDAEIALKNLCEEIQHTGKGGKIIIEIGIKPDTNAGIVKVAGSVKLNMPKRTPKESVFFFTPEGNLARTDTRQRSMFPSED